MNKTSNSIYSTKPNTRPSSRSNMNNTQNSFDKKSTLRELLSELNIENIEPRLKEKNILTADELKSKLPEEIDQWKDIQVGYRIKMKKYIERNNQRQP